MSAKLYVCQSQSCGSLGSNLLVRDIEELCQSECEVMRSSCVDQCGKGPNIEVHYCGSKAKKAKVVINRVNTFDKALKIVQSEAGLVVGKIEKQVAKLKYDARRVTNPVDAVAKINGAFKLMGGESKAAAEQKRWAGDLLAMRSIFTVQTGANIASALAHAQRAIELRKNWAQPYFAAALAYEASKDFLRAVEALDKANDIQDGLDASDTRNAYRRIRIHLPKESKSDNASAVVAAPQANHTTDGNDLTQRASKAKLGEMKTPLVQASVLLEPLAKAAGAKPKTKAKGKAKSKAKAKEVKTAYDGSADQSDNVEQLKPDVGSQAELETGSTMCVETESTVQDAPAVDADAPAVAAKNEVHGTMDGGCSNEGQTEAIAGVEASPSPEHEVALKEDEQHAQAANALKPGLVAVEPRKIADVVPEKHTSEFWSLFSCSPVCSGRSSQENDLDADEPVLQQA